MADVVSVYPANGAEGVFLSESIYVDFDELMDHDSINRGTFVVTGPEHTLFSGPDTLRWLDLLEDEELFDSPGFEGFMQGTISFETRGGGSESYHTRAVFTPSINLAPNTTFKVYIWTRKETLVLSGKEEWLSRFGHRLQRGREKSIHTLLS